MFGQGLIYITVVAVDIMNICVYMFAFKIKIILFTNSPYA